jgi:hypothetical protein
MTLSSYEANIILTIQSLQNNPKLSVRAAAKAYGATRYSS